MEDGHPTSGTLAFRLNAEPASADSDGTAASGSPAQIAPQPSETVRGAWAAVRWLGYLALALYVGGLGFVAMLWPHGAQDRRTRRILTLSWTAGLAASLHSPMLAKGGSWSHTFTTAGTYGSAPAAAATRRSAVSSMAGTPGMDTASPEKPAKPAAAPSSSSWSWSRSPSPTPSAAAAAVQPALDTTSAASDARRLEPLLLLTGVVAGVAVLCLLLVGARSAAVSRGGD